MEPLVGAETSCLEAWQAIDLGNVQLALDEQASAVADFREASLESRKALAMRTKVFKGRKDVREADEASVVRVELPKLLRAYQEEVDKVTQRAKFAENCFLAMYRLVREAPDPSDALASASKAVFEARMAHAHTSELLTARESEVQQLQGALDKALAEADRLRAKAPQRTRNASDVEDPEGETQRRLLDEAALREALENEIEQRYRDELDEFRASADEELADANAQLELAHIQTEQQLATIRALEADLAAAQGSGGSSASLTEDRLREADRTARFEEENLNLVHELEAVREDQAQSRQRLAALQHEVDQARAEAAEQVAQLHKLVEVKAVALDDARRQLKGLPSAEDHAKLRSQLAMIRRELFGAEDDEADQGEAPGQAHGSALSEPDGLEAWFIKATRQLKKELIDAKRVIAEQEAEIAELKRAEERLGEALKDQSDLTARLERDLAQATLRFQGSATGHERGGSLMPDLSASSPVTSQTAQPTGESQHDTLTLQGSAHTVAKQPALDGPRATKVADQQHQALNSMLQAVCAQRDRLRAQLDAGDERLESQRKEVEEAYRRCKTLEEDNVALYQRIRFLQNYKVSERSTLIADGGGADMEAGIHREGSAVILSARGAKVGGLGRGVEHKYRDLYESDISPVQAFQKHEAERLYHNMPKVERVVLRVCNAFLTRSRGRNFLAAYSLLVHVALALCLLV